MKLKEKFIVKLLAIVLFAVFLTSALLSTACIVYGFGSGAFLSENERAESRNKISTILLYDAYREIRETLDIYATNKDMENVKFEDFNIALDSENIVYEIKASNGELIFSNVNVPTSDIYISETHDIFSFDDRGIEQELLGSYTVDIYLVENLTMTDGFYYFTMFFDFVANNAIKLVVIDLLSIIKVVCLCIFIFCSAGHKRGTEGIHISRFDRLPFDVLTAIYVGITALAGLSVFAYFSYVYDVTLYGGMQMISILSILAILIVACIVIDFILLAVLLTTLAVRLKTKTFIKSTLIFIVLRLIFKLIKKLVIFGFNILKKCHCFNVSVISKIPMVWKTVLAVVVILIAELFAITYWWENGIILIWILNAVLGVGVIFVAVLLKQIQKGTEDIARGNTYKKINTKYMFLDIKNHAENINNINDGIASAVEERMKSERFKTELITNVSHDIKTPLTSIINYVDLLEKEELQNEKAQEYVEVLSRQSTRLKKLIEDLIEASKASTGNINVSLSRFDLGILLTQALGEYEERFKNADLQLVVNTTDEPLFIKADNRHIWRILDNVLNNILKYAQPNTRVYVDINRKNEIAEISFKNVSKDPLNITGAELMERFVRGDSSRNTEGSGLGLSIAKSLAEVQKGTLDIDIDGDFFKLRVALPLAN